MWKIKKIISNGCYNYALVPEHPNATSNGYVLEHRIVIENMLGRILSVNEIIHHIDGDGKNNCPGNLEVMSKSEHARMHMLKRGRKMATLLCPACGCIFDREYRQTFLAKKGEYTCCSRVCRGKFSRMIQLGGETSIVKHAKLMNIVSLWNSKSVSQGDE